MNLFPSKRFSRAEERVVPQGGFTALYAVIVASLALAIGLSIANLVLKESLISSLAVESQSAFYAANSGLECARYWESQLAFDPPPGGPAATIVCDGQTVAVDDGGVGDCSLGCSFQINFISGPECVIVEVQKDATGTTVEALGYNTCDPNDQKRVEQAFRQSF